MAISSKSIVHYTRNLKSLKSIIYDGHLRVKYCTEDVRFYSSDNTRSGIAFPMVCFCDLPLTLAKEHIDKYGSYGIGLSKEWAKRNKLNPVLYLEKDSTLSVYIIKHCQKAVAVAQQNENDEKIEAEFYTISQILGFCKNHIGTLERANKKVVENYVFYDEREWRYIPDRDVLNGALSMITGANYHAAKQQYNNSLKHLQLKFSHNDISYIIVKSERDIPIIVDCLEARYRSEIPFTELQKLFTKIVSVSQIHNDF